jgi:hypothetical protein
LVFGKAWDRKWSREEGVLVGGGRVGLEFMPRVLNTAAGVGEGAAAGDIG